MTKLKFYSIIKEQGKRREKLNFINLHCHSDYSNIRLLDSINKVPNLIDTSFSLGYKGIALTDHECLSGHIKAIKHLRQQKEKNKIDKNFKLILGNEIYLIDDREKYKTEYDSSIMKYYHFILLAKNKQGHKILREASSKAWLNSYVQRGMHRVPITYKELAEIVKKSPGNVIASTACLGSFFAQKVLQHIGDESNQKIKNEIHDFIFWCIDVFGKENFYIEIQPNPTSSEQIIYNTYAVKIANAYNLSVIVTTDAHYELEKDREVHKAYLNSQFGDREVDDFYASTYLMTSEEILQILMESNGFSEKAATSYILNTMQIYEACEEYDLAHEIQIPTIPIEKVQLQHLFSEYYDEFEYIKNFAYSPYQQDQFLLKQIEDGYQKKQKIKNYSKTPHIERINTELKELWEISENLGSRISSYYNTAQKLIDIMWNEGDSLVGPARGSVTGFFICYLIDIVQMDAIEWSLPHWRLAV